MRARARPQVSKKKYIYTIDDDCFVAKDPSGADINALEQHIRNLLTPSTPLFFNTLYDPYAAGADFVRGYPFSLREGCPTAISHGAPRSRAQTKHACSSPCLLKTGVWEPHCIVAALLVGCVIASRVRRRPVAEHPGLRRADADGEAAGAQHALCGRRAHHPQGALVEGCCDSPWVVSAVMAMQQHVGHYRTAMPSTVLLLIVLWVRQLGFFSESSLRAARQGHRQHRAEHTPQRAS